MLLDLQKKLHVAEFNDNQDASIDDSDDDACSFFNNFVFVGERLSRMSALNLLSVVYLDLCSSCGANTGSTVCSRHAHHRCVECIRRSLKSSYR